MHCACRLLHYTIDLFHINFSAYMLHREHLGSGMNMLQRYDIRPGPTPGLGSSTLGTRPSSAIKVSQEVLRCQPWTDTAAQTIGWQLTDHLRCHCCEILPKIFIWWHFHSGESETGVSLIDVWHTVENMFSKSASYQKVMWSNTKIFCYSWFSYQTLYHMTVYVRAVLSVLFSLFWFKSRCDNSVNTTKWIRWDLNSSWHLKGD